MLKTGDYLALVLNCDGVPRVSNVKIETDEPLTVLMPCSEWTDSLKPGTRVSLIWRGQSEGAHSDATVTDVTKFGLSLVVKLSDVAWSDFERRRAPRFRIDLESEITLVTESGGMPAFNKLRTSIIDMSLVGCRLVIDHELEPGSLIAISIFTGDGDPLKMLSVVTRTFAEPKGYALEFFDFLGNTRFRLNEFLSSFEEAA